MLPSMSSTSHRALVGTPLEATDVERLALLTPAWLAGRTALTPAWLAGRTALTPAWLAGRTALTPAWLAGRTVLTPAWLAGRTALTPAWLAGRTALTPAWLAGRTALTPAWLAGRTALTPAWLARTGEAETIANTYKVAACVCTIFISLPLCSTVLSQIPTHHRHLQRSGNNLHPS